MLLQSGCYRNALQQGQRICWTAGSRTNHSQSRITLCEKANLRASTCESNEMLGYRGCICQYVVITCRGNKKRAVTCDFFPPTHKCQRNVAGCQGRLDFVYLGMLPLNIKISCNNNYPPSHCQWSYLGRASIWPKHTHLGCHV